MEWIEDYGYLLFIKEGIRVKVIKVIFLHLGVDDAFTLPLVEQKYHKSSFEYTEM